MMTAKFSPVCLLILDGWGIGPSNSGNAIKQANTLNIDKYWNSYPHALLGATGESVGLPNGEDGNTETGHLNLGAGQIVYQDLPKINMAIADGSFFKNKQFLDAFSHVKKNKSNLHLMGLVGSGGVHSSIGHLYAMLNACKINGLTSNVYLHLFTDGRDSPPTSGLAYVTQVNNKTIELGVGKIASIMGRYYAMDRDSRWSRTEVSYKALTMGVGEVSGNFIQSIKNSYDNGVTDEFIKPIIVTDENGQQMPNIKDNDSVIFINFRIDRPRQLTKAFLIEDFKKRAGLAGSFDPYAIKYFKSHLRPTSQAGKPFERKRFLKNLFFVTMTEYEKGLAAKVAFPPTIVQMPLSRIVSENNLRQLKVAETEKQRFVTYYFNGQREIAFMGEDWKIVDSKKVATYDIMPEMSSREIAQAVLDGVNSGYKMIVANFAGADMVAHTGNLKATIKACEVVDECVGKIVDKIDAIGGVVIITADHGNAEEMINMETKEIDTEHSNFPVPFILVSKHFIGQSNNLDRGILADVAPTMLKLLGIPIPSTMMGRSLI